MNAWPGNAQPLVRLLGQCRIGEGGRLAYRKGWALLAYLAVERPRVHRRSRIAAMLWPDLAPGAALTNLRQVLADLNRAIVAVAGEGVLLIDREHVHLCPEASQGLFDIDLLEPAQIAGSAAREWLEDAGELLEGVALERCDEFCEWLPGARAWALQRLLNALERAREDATASQDLEVAVNLCRRHVMLDPWNESQQRSLMRLYAQRGEPDMALHCYRTLARGLEQELAVKPQTATHTLAMEIAQRHAAAPSLRGYGRIRTSHAAPQDKAMRA
ncbi:BTAD domain-containing putative transcriptional regulator [Stenotrophomonas acidaminiphila]|uniref:AfsR/SARP family transcriptional regulator n=1 Tax=Stenotrophomonas acidaminiphila TaxID=128780 RepID=UPI00289A6CA4|nr:BTAD domain-containing putative transcriptional regulator [Stenotrophomonas acidaminiphila]